MTTIALNGLGERVRHFRTEKGMTIQELAGSSGVALSSLYKIESDRMVPSILTMIKIARALGRGVGEFTDDPEGVRRSVLIRAKDRERFRRNRMGYTGERISAFLPRAQLYGTWLRVKGGGRGGGIRREQARYSGEEIALCLKGRFQFEVEGEIYTLSRGDSLHFKGGSYSWKNLGRGGGELLMVLTPPPFMYGG